MSMITSHGIRSHIVRGLEYFAYPYRHPANNAIIPVNPLDEFETINYYGFQGKKDMSHDFRVLVVGDQSSGDELLFIAAQLLGTQAEIVNLDFSKAGTELTRQRALQFEVDHGIQWVTSELTAFDPSRFGTFDYIRCVNALDHSIRFDGDFNHMLSLLNPDGVLGMSCLAFYGREVYRQMQEIATLYNTDSPELADQVYQLKELFFHTPESNQTRRAYENLLPGVRGLRDDAFVGEFLRADTNGFSVEQLYRLLDSRHLTLSQFSRKTRPFYQPWFASTSPELKDLFATRTSREIHAISEMAWSRIEHHEFWATRTPSPRTPLNDPDNIPFFNPFALNRKDWKSTLLAKESWDAPELTVIISDEEEYKTRLPWNPVIRDMVELIDGKTTMGEIIAVLAENHTSIPATSILQQCMDWIAATELEDILLLRHRNVPLLPFASHLVS